MGIEMRNEVQEAGCVLHRKGFGEEYTIFARSVCSLEYSREQNCVTMRCV